MGRVYSTKEKLGTLIYDWPRLLAALSHRRGWVRMRNRADKVSRAADGRGVVCCWDYTRTVHVADVFPFTGAWLMRRALAEWPIRTQARPLRVAPSGCCSNGPGGPEEQAPEVSILIGHRGRQRLPLLQTVLQSLAAQTGVRFEVIVVEQDATPLIKDALPDWVRYVHTPCPPAMPYGRAWAFNVAARAARAPLLILQDNDMPAPSDYAAQALRLFQQGWDVMNLKRFVFYLAEPRNDEAPVQAARADARVESVVQNLEGGGSVAIGAAAYQAIGGFDEAFVGWGGEDNEFWDRCLTRKTWTYGYLPIVHLWHPPQPGKRLAGGMGTDTAALTRKRRAVPAEERIDALRGRPRGNPDGPNPEWKPAS